MIPVTALILTYNEQENIGRALEALRRVPAVLVLDSFSSDDTAQIAQSFANVRFVQRKFDTHATQWNFGLDQIETEWVLTLDADYVVSPKLAEEVGRLKMEDGVDGYSAEFRYLILGKPLRASLYPPRIVLFRTTKGRYVDEGHTQQLKIMGRGGKLIDGRVIDGKLAASPTEEGRIEKLSGKIDHDDRKPLSRWITSQDRYARLEAENLLKEKGESSKAKEGKSEVGDQNSQVGADKSAISNQKSAITVMSLQDKLRKMIFVAPMIMPFYLLFARGLILDGWRGWYYVFQRTIAEMMLSLRLIELRLSTRSAETP